jgi:hypothetical protein
MNWNLPAHNVVQWWPLWSVMNLQKEYHTPQNYKTQCRFMVFTKCTHTCNVCYPSDAVLAADCSDLSPCWSQHQLHCSTHRLPILSNARICKYKHNDKLTSQQYRDTCTWISRETTIFRHVNMLSYCTFWQFWTEAFCQVQQHYGSHGWPMKKRGQWLGSQIATPQWDTKM